MKAFVFSSHWAGSSDPTGPVGGGTQTENENETETGSPRLTLNSSVRGEGWPERACSTVAAEGVKRALAG